MGSFTHEDTGHNSSASSTSLAVTLSGAVDAGDLLVLWVQSAGAASTSVTDDSGNSWSNPDSGALWFCASAADAPSGVTITATVTSNAVYQMIADRFSVVGSPVYGSYNTINSAGTLGLNYNSAGCGSLGTVPVDALAWGAFSCNDTAGDQAYTAGFQTGTTAPANVVGSQFTGAHGTGLSVYVTDCANENATLTWYGTGSGSIGPSGSMYFTAIAPPPAALFTHEDSVIVQATTNVTVLTATLTEPVSAGDLLVCAVKSPDGSVTSSNLTDSAGNTWVTAGGGNYLYLAYVLASNAAPSGLTVTITTAGVSHHGIVVDRFTPSSGYVAQFVSFADNLDLSSFSTGLNYPYGNHPAGSLTSVPAGDLAYMGFFVLAGDSSCVYSSGYQDGSSGTPTDIGSQVTESNGDGGFSEYLLSTDSTGNVAMQWFGTGANNGGWAVEGVFTHTTTSVSGSVSFFGTGGFMLGASAGIAHMSGSGSFSAKATSTYARALNLSGSGSFTVVHEGVRQGIAAFAGSGSFTAGAANVTKMGAVHFSGSGSFEAQVTGARDTRTALHLGGIFVGANLLGGTATRLPLGGSLVETNILGGLAIVADLLDGTLVEWTMQEVDIVLAEYNDDTLNLSLTSGGSAYDITDLELDMYLKAKAGDADNAGTTTKLSTTTGEITITNASQGQATVAIPNADLQASAYTFYRVDVVNDSKKNTAIYGKVAITSL